MGFLGEILGTNSNYQYDSGGINNAQTVWDAQQQQKLVNEKQQGLANTLLDQSQGAGPNPAMEMLRRQTSTNNANNAGFIASQKGINPALAARLAAQNNAMANQDAASQGAVLGAQQQLAAQQQLQGLYGTMGQQNLYQQNLGQQGISAMNNINAGISSQNAANNAGVVGSVLGATGKAIAGAAHGGEIQKGSDLHDFLENFVNGGQVDGTPKVMGDHPINDTVAAKLSPGEVVIPNSVMQSSDPVSNSAKFVAALMAKKKRMVK